MATNKLKKKIGIGRHASAIKRARQTEKRRINNKSCISKMRTALKSARANPGSESFAKAAPLIMKTAKKGVIHRKKASRLISRLARQSNAAARA